MRIALDIVAVLTIVMVIVENIEARRYRTLQSQINLLLRLKPHDQVTDNWYDAAIIVMTTGLVLGCICFLISPKLLLLGQSLLCLGITVAWVIVEWLIAKSKHKLAEVKQINKPITEKFNWKDLIILEFQIFNIQTVRLMILLPRQFAVAVWPSGRWRRLFSRWPRNSCPTSA